LRVNTPPMPNTKTTPRDSSASWFGALPTGNTSKWADAGIGESSFAESPRALNASQRKDDALHIAKPIDANRPSFHRIYRAFLTARFALAVVLLSLVTGSWLLGGRPPLWLALGALGYALATIALLTMPIQTQDKRTELQSLRPRQALLSVGVDLTFFAVMHNFTGSAVNSQALLVLPVLMASVLMPRIMALGVAAVATLNLLGTALLQSGDGNNLTTVMTQAGLTGFGLFAIAVLAGELSARLTKEERSARGSLEMAHQQAQLNRLVIEEMGEGVMVVDRRGRVRTANPAARRLLTAQGLAQPAPFQLRGVPAWFDLVKAVERAQGSPQSAEEGQDVRLQFDDQTQRDLRLRVRFTKGKDGRTPEDMCVMLLEDLRAVRARQRQDKLAAMGRMSAGIAHEIRNPLAAISQANALLAEDASTPTQHKLTQLVTDNVGRLKHIVDDILAVAPGLRPPAPAIDPIETIVAICNDWRSTQGLAAGDDSLLDVDTRGCQRAPFYPHIKVRFEPEHLQRVLVNLLDNAQRYNTGEPGAINVTLNWLPSVEPSGILLLSISNDGPPVSAENERALFEPFFSTRSRGTGLGLYICRELCERHGAHIDYRLHPPPLRHRNEFFVTVPVEPLASTTHTA
jgi:two-component system sensor histidine kinase PilS (NtrC family)